MAYNTDTTIRTGQAADAFKPILTTAIIARAKAIYAADAATPANDSDKKRRTLANQVLMRPNEYADIFMAAIVSGGNQAQAWYAVDANLDTAIAGVWNALAGVGI